MLRILSRCYTSATEFLNENWNYVKSQFDSDRTLNSTEGFGSLSRRSRVKKL